MNGIKRFFGSYREAVTVLVGEIIVSLLTALVFFLVGSLDYTVWTGAALGSAVVVINLFILSISVNRAIDKYLALRGESEMDEESAAEFAAENAAQVRLAASGTYLIRTLLMVAAVVCAFLIKEHFNVIATVIPLLAYRPIIYVTELIRNKIANKSIQNVVITEHVADEEADISARDSEAEGSESKPEEVD